MTAKDVPFERVLELAAMADVDESRSTLAYEHGLSWYDSEKSPSAPFAECSDPECAVCSVLICKHRDPLHFHHDGCPTCSQKPEAMTQSITLNVTAEEYLQRLRDLNASLPDDEFVRVAVAMEEALMVMKNRYAAIGPNGFSVAYELNRRIEQLELALKLVQPPKAFKKAT